jgi:hypothetical protein
MGKDEIRKQSEGSWEEEEKISSCILHVLSISSE